MGTHFLRHFAHNHASKHQAKPVQLPQRMRFKSGGLVDPPAKSEAANPYTYASPTGNGNHDLSTPYYGSFAHHYGPVYQLLTPVSGYGGYPGTIDPRGFNAPTQNFTAGVFTQDFKQPPTQPNLLGKHVGLMGPMASAGVPAAGIPFANQALNYHPGGAHTFVQQISGTIPVMYPNGASKGLSNVQHPGMGFAPGIGFAPGAPGIIPPFQAAAAGIYPLQAAAAGIMAGTPGMHPLGASAMMPGRPMHPLAATSGFMMRSPYNPSYSLGMMQHRQLTLNGATAGFVTPGFFHPMSTNYPTPDTDRYSSVRNDPVLPPNYGKENAAAGSGAAAAF